MRMVYEPAASQVTVMDFWAAEFEKFRGIVQAASWDDGGVPQLDNLTLQYNQGGPGAWTTLGTAATNSASHRITNLQHAGMLAAGNNQNFFDLVFNGHDSLIIGKGEEDFEKSRAVKKTQENKCLFYVLVAVLL